MDKHTLKAQPRTVTGRKVKNLRRSALIPANLFGKTIKSTSIQVSSADFPKVYAAVGESTLVYLQIEGDKEEKPVLVRDVVFDPVTSQILHVDFNQVSLKEKITAPVALRIVGESQAVKEKVGIFVQQLDQVEVEALPTDMPEHIDVDISGLAAVGDAMYVKDLKVESKITIQTDPEAIVVKIDKLAEEEKVEAPVVAEGEVPAEGETAAPAEGEAPSATDSEEKAKE